MPELAVLDPPRRIDPHVKLGSSILKSAIHDFKMKIPRNKGPHRTEALEAAVEAEILLFPASELGRRHLQWIFDLANCNRETWQRNLDAMPKKQDVERKQLVLLQRYILAMWPDLQ